MHGNDTKISAIVRADNGGLGTLSRMFAEFWPGGFHRTVSISRHEGEHDPERFGANNRHAADGLTAELIEWLCQGADVLLTFECWYGGEVPAIARALGCKTALMPMYECCPQRGGGLEHTDLAVCPSRLDLREVEYDTPGLSRAMKTFLPVPFDTRRIPFRPRQRAETFAHHQGHGGVDGRNATQQVLDAWQFVRSAARLVVKRQPSAAALRVPTDRRIRVIERDVTNYWDLWGEGDVFLHPHRWDGLSLPIQEACAAGLPVMTTRYWPFCDFRLPILDFGLEAGAGHESKIGNPKSKMATGWLPRWCQNFAIDSSRASRQRICREFTAYEVTPQAIAAAVDRAYGENIREASHAVRRVAQRWSWERLGFVYSRLFRNFVEGYPIPEVYLEA